MNCSRKLSWKELLALIMVLSVSVLAFPMLWLSEGNIQIPLNDTPSAKVIAHMVDDGLKPYFYAMGILFLIVSAAFILFDREEKLTTKADPAQEENS